MSKRLMLITVLLVLLTGCAGRPVSESLDAARRRGTTTSTGTRRTTSTSQASTPRPSTRPTSTETPSTDARSVTERSCAAATSVLATLERLVDQPDLDGFQAAMAPARLELREAAGSAPAGVRQPIEAMGLLLDQLEQRGRAARAAAASTARPEVVEATDELVLELDRVLFHPVVFAGLVASGADDCAAIERALDDPPTVDPLETPRRLVARLRALDAGGIADAFVPEGMLEITDRDMTVALSGMQREYERCMLDPGADAYGDNGGCDALHDACDARNLVACNDLYFSTAPGSAYEEFAATCGHRTTFGAVGYAGWCEDLDGG